MGKGVLPIGVALKPLSFNAIKYLASFKLNVSSKLHENVTMEHKVLHIQIVVQAMIFSQWDKTPKRLEYYFVKFEGC